MIRPHKLLRIEKRLGDHNMQKKRTRKNFKAKRRTNLAGAFERLGKRLLVSNAQGPVSTGGLFPHQVKKWKEDGLTSGTGR